MSITIQVSKMENFSDKIDAYKGLTAEEAAERLDMYGYNSDSRLDEADGDFKVFGVLFSFRFLVMVISSGFILSVGRVAEGFVMLLLAAFYSATEIFKGVKCRDAFHELKRVSGVKFRVLRDGAIVLIRKENIVPDDIIILQEGESVPADAHLLEAGGLSADESLFTGDRAPALKRAGADGKNDLKQTCIYKGTRILSGNAVARVTATGIDTKKCRELGEDHETHKKAYKTGIETAAGKVSPVFYAAAAIFFVLYFLITFFGNGADSFDSFGELTVNLLIPAFSLALCFVPAETPKLVRAHYLYGAFSLLNKNCVVKDLNAMENLSAITAICVDKTGIITKSHTEPIDEYTTDAETLSRISVLSCDPSDATSLDRAIILGAAFKGVDVKTLQDNELVCRYPFSEETKLGGNLWRINNSLLLCVKGSPESVLMRCDLQPDYLFSVQQKQQKYSEQGHRVIAVAYARIAAENDGAAAERGIAPESVYDADYTFVGLIAFTNKTRDSVPVAVRSCYRAGVKVIMTTGDSADAAVAIGRKIGFADASAVTGDYLRDCLKNGDAPEITDVNIFARVTPDQKPYIISLLRENGEIVAVTGIGAADVEALGQANVGVALPQETSGAAKEVCGLVLADDDFNSVVDALKETRQIHYNIKQTIGTVVCAVTAAVMFALFCLFSGNSIGVNALSPAAVCLPAVLFLPLLTLAFFGNRADIKGTMSPSGFVGRGALDKRFVIKAVTQGLCASLSVLIFQLILKEQSAGVLHSCFLASVTGALIGTVAVNLSSCILSYKLLKEKGNAARTVIAISLGLLTALVYIPFVNSAFGLSAMNPLIFIAVILTGIISQMWVEIPKIREGLKRT